MENAADALKMAGAVLIFVLAISIAILSFGQVRETADIILDYKDRETVYIDGDYYYKASGTERQVGLETIIPSITRAYLENYKIVFDGLDNPIYILNDADKTQKKSLDLESNEDSKNVILANNDQKAEFLCGILYHKFKTDKKDFEKKFNISLENCSSLYDQLTQAASITEYLGVYYQDDKSSDDKDSNTEDIPEANKTEKRIITYKLN